MRVSISLTNYSWPGEPGNPHTHGRRLAEIAAVADQVGLDTVWVPDHLLQADPTVGADDHDMLEAYTTLGYLAAVTDRVRLGTAVSAVTFREPALLIKAVDTVNALSGGRAWLGIGAGYHAEEADAMGLPLPPVAERFERLEETVQIAARMWAGDAAPFEGTHYRLTRPVGRPAPLRRPPIMIGGTGERRTLRLVARYADACNVFDIPDGGTTVRHNLDVLARHCSDVGRPYADIEKTMGTRLSDRETVHDLIARAREASALGIEHLVFVSSAPWTPARLAPLAAAVPAITEIERTAGCGTSPRSTA
ncbi:TIGR03560 family F420-dependent LLM class oxidoreductase [Pseudonocardia kunmingensis]|uniref:F420-dependent oxidoreductase-like protein n=1 Tax=Pseudonocardia kunmingensis TaxID=630975 RepID=A0A543DAZ7_9PSEU|nr:TIGR03560 family F420-dependent LLM class oxidoreductase [Pseudonocardia kunmingensis]TQM06455.1 F420-dependent oxidoreductase-like protein [Pseudonocardia kunmingensis]